MQQKSQRAGISVVLANDSCIDEVAGGVVINYGFGELEVTGKTVAYTALAAWLAFSTWDQDKQVAFIANCERMAANFKRTHMTAFYLGAAGVASISNGFKNAAIRVRNYMTNNPSATPSAACAQANP